MLFRSAPSSLRLRDQFELDAAQVDAKSGGPSASREGAPPGGRVPCAWAGRRGTYLQRIGWRERRREAVSRRLAGCLRGAGALLRRRRLVLALGVRVGWRLRGLRGARWAKLSRLPRANGAGMREAGGDGVTCGGRGATWSRPPGKTVLGDLGSSLSLSSGGEAPH